MQKARKIKPAKSPAKKQKRRVTLPKADQLLMADAMKAQRRASSIIQIGLQGAIDAAKMERLSGRERGLYAAYRLTPRSPFVHASRLTY